MGNDAGPAPKLIVWSRVGILLIFVRGWWVSQTMIRGFRIARRKEEPEPGAQGSALFTLKSYDHQVEFASEGHRLLKSRHVADGSI